MTLFADVTTHTGFFPDEFLPSLVMSVIFAVVALFLFAAFWKFIHWVTPGDLDREILGTKEGAEAKPPNIALAIIVGALAIGFCQIIAAAIK